jgi:hypothetical protein
MSETEYELLSDPRRVFVDGPIAKQAERDRLARIFAPQAEAEPEEETIEELADLVAERVAAKLREP